MERGCQSNDSLDDGEYKGRLVYKRFAGRTDILDEYRRFQGDVFSRPGWNVPKQRGMANSGVPRPLPRAAAAAGESEGVRAAPVVAAAFPADRVVDTAQFQRDGFLILPHTVLPVALAALHASFNRLTDRQPVAVGELSF